MVYVTVVYVFNLKTHSAKNPEKHENRLRAKFAELYLRPTVLLLVYTNIFLLSAVFICNVHYDIDICFFFKYFTIDLWKLIVKLEFLFSILHLKAELDNRR